MLQLTLLNSIAPKLRLNRSEPLDARYISWFTDGYRASAPGTNVCRQNTDCEVDEICQGGYCTGLNRIAQLHGLYYGDLHTNLLTDHHPLSHLLYSHHNFNDATQLFHQPDDFVRGYSHDYEYDYDYE